MPPNTLCVDNHEGHRRCSVVERCIVGKWWSLGTHQMLLSQPSHGLRSKRCSDFASGQTRRPDHHKRRFRQTDSPNPAISVHSIQDSRHSPMPRVSTKTADGSAHSEGTDTGTNPCHMLLLRSSCMAILFQCFLQKRGLPTCREQNDI